MVSYAVRMDKVEDYTHSKEVALIKGTSAMQRFMLWMSWIILALEDKCLNELKLDAVQRKMLRQGNIMEKNASRTHMQGEAD